MVAGWTASRLCLRLLIDGADERVLWPVLVYADDVATFPTKSGSVESLKLSAHCGWIVLWLSPDVWAIDRVFQWVAR